MQFSQDIYKERRKYPNSSSILPIGYHGLLQKLLDKKITLAEMDQEYQKMAKQIRIGLICCFVTLLVILI